MSDFTVLSAHIQSALLLTPEQRDHYVDSLPPELAEQVRQLLQFECASLDLSRADGIALALNIVAEPMPAQIGRWSVQRMLGHGGMASVFLVERSEGTIRQLAACKIGYAQTNLEDGLRRETATLLDLGHPGIAKVLDFGQTENGRPYMVSELVEGSDIVAHARSLSLSLTARLQLFEDVLSAVAHAHERLVLHQDLKPGNILVDGAGRTRLIDFGLATMLSSHGDTPVLGYTPRFASPEQKRGDVLGVRSDIYSLGVTLSALLEDVAAAQGHDVHAVIDKACQHDPQARYPSAEAMANDLRAIRASRPVSAHASTAGYRLRKFLQRHPWPVAVAAALLLMTVFGLAAYVRQTQHAIAAGERAERERQRAVATSTFLTELFGSVVPNEGGRVEMKLSEFLEPAFDRLKNNTDLPDGARIDIVAALASAYASTGNIERAVEARAYGIALASASGDHRSQARLLTDQADMYIARQDIAQANAAYDRAIAIKHDDAELRGRAQFSRMSAAFMHEHWEEVLELAQRLQNDIDAGAVPAIKFQAGVAYSQATAFMRLGRQDEAEAAALRSQEAYVARHGHNSGPVANVLDIRMQNAMAANRNDLADELAIDVLRVAEHVFGKSHARYGEILTNVGLLRQTQGRTAEASALYRQSHDITQASYGPDNPRAATLQMNLGSALVMLDDPVAREEGIGHLRHANRVLIDTLGADHRMTIKSGGLLAGAEGRAGNVGSALKQFEQLDAAFARIAPDSFDRADLLVSYATTLLEDNRHADCVQRIDQAADILKKVYAHDHWYFDMYAAYRAYCRAQLGDAGAAAQLDTALAALAVQLPADSTDLLLIRKLRSRIDQH